MGPRSTAFGFDSFGIRNVGVRTRVRHRVILQIALAPFIANRTVERMIDEKELEHHRAPGVDFIATRAHDHAVAYDRIAGDLQLRHAFDFHQTDAAESRRPEFSVITIDRNLLLDRLCSFDQQRALRHAQGHAVDR